MCVWYLELKGAANMSESIIHFSNFLKQTLEVCHTVGFLAEISVLKQSFSVVPWRPTLLAALHKWHQARFNFNRIPQTLKQQLGHSRDLHFYV